MQYTAARDVIVNAIVLIAPERSFADKAAGRLFEHPDFDPAGIYTMPNMTTLESLNLYAAAIDFLAERYSRPDKKYGRVHHWIAHNEVDAGWVWTNAGIEAPLRFMDIYIKSMRLLYYTARKYSPHPEVFITLTHYWQSRHNEYCYPSAQLLELLVDYTQAEGDFKWGVAHHPYPQSLFEPKSWLDDQATFDYDTPTITFKNLEVLDAWIKQPRALYQGKIKRTVFLSEQNPNSKDYSEEALREQAAGMAYAMKKLEACDGIDAYQMHGWFDQRAEGGLRIGVRRFMDDETDTGRTQAGMVRISGFRDGSRGRSIRVRQGHYRHRRLGSGDLQGAYSDEARTERLNRTFDRDEQVEFFENRHIVGRLQLGVACFAGGFSRAAFDAGEGSSIRYVTTDALGRALPGFDECGPRKGNRVVGMFYFVTHNNNGAKQGPFDVTKILAADPEHPKWGGGTHPSGRARGRLLYYEGRVDHSTSCAPVVRCGRRSDRAGQYERPYLRGRVLFYRRRVPADARRRRADAADRVSGRSKSVELLWDKIYSRGLYADLWFRWKGKPLLLFGQHVTGNRQQVNDVRFPKAITDFFTIRQSWAWTTLRWYDDGHDEWPWVDHYPQSVGWSESPNQAEYVPVAVAEHPLSNIGRSFHDGVRPKPTVTT